MAEKNHNVSSFVAKLQDILSKAEFAVSAIAFTLMLVDVIAGIIMRKFLQLPFPWGEEAARYLMIAGVLTGLGICARNRTHMRVDIFISFLPALPQKILNIFSDLVTLACYVFLVVVTIVFIHANSSLGQVSASLKIPIYYVYYTLLLGFSLALIEHILVFVNDYIFTNQTEKEDN